MEKRKLYGGDKSILYEKLGIVDETDIDKFRKKMGVGKDVDINEIDLEDLKTGEDGGIKSEAFKKRGYMSRKKEQFEIEEFKKMVESYKE
jgi:hypothetical protein